MLNNINPIYINNINKYKQTNNIQKNQTTNPQIEPKAMLPIATQDYSVKVPLSYSKTGEISFPYDIMLKR